MVAVAFVLLWSGYSGGLWGWSLLRGYDVTLGQLVSPMHPYSGGWPPGPIPDTQVWPGHAGAPGAAAAQQSPAAKGRHAPPVIRDILHLAGLGK